MKSPLLFLAVFIFAYSNVSYAGDVEAIQLEYVPVDASLKCKRIFFTSSQHFKNAIYAVPLVMPAVNENNEQIGAIGPNLNKAQDSDKDYIFDFPIYFPVNEFDMKSKLPPTEAARVDSCNFEMVKKSLNAIRERTGEEKIDIITDMPVSSIEVSLPDFSGASVTIGRNDAEKTADVSTYSGQTFTIRLPLSKKEMITLTDSLKGDFGMQARVRFSFNARSNNGSVNVQFDSESLAVNFQAAANGEKFMTRAKVQLALKVAVSKTAITANRQAGTDENFEKFSMDVLAKVLEQIDLKTVPVEEPTAGDPAESEGKISVEIVANLLRGIDSRSFTISNGSVPEVANAYAVVPLKPKLADPNIMLVRVAAGETEPSLAEPISKGQTIRIIPAFESLVVREHKQYDSYLTLEQLNEKAYSDFVADLFSNDNFTVTDEERNGNYMAVGRWSWLEVSKWTTEYMWKKTEMWPEIVSNSTVKMGTRLKDFSRFPVCVAFTNIGQQRKLFPLAKLIGNNSFFVGRYDEETNEIVVTAKRDLGMMVFRSRFLLNDSNDAEDLNLTDEDREILASCQGKTANRKAVPPKDWPLGPKNSYIESQWDYQRIKVSADKLIEIQRGFFTEYQEDYVTIKCKSLDIKNIDVVRQYPQCVTRDIGSQEFELLPIETDSVEDYVRTNEYPRREVVIRSERKANYKQQIVYYSVSRPQVDSDELKRVHLETSDTASAQE